MISLGALSKYLMIQSSQCDCKLHVNIKNHCSVQIIIQTYKIMILILII